MPFAIDGTITKSMSLGLGSWLQSGSLYTNFDLGTCKESKSTKKMISVNLLWFQVQLVFGPL